MSTSISPLTRIVSSNLPLPESLTNDPEAEPAVQILRTKLEPEVLGDAKRTCIHVQSVPGSNNGLGDIQPATMPPPGIVMPGGIIVQFFEMAPRSKVPIHRTTSTDYVLMHSGSLTLLTPTTAFSPTSPSVDTNTFTSSVLKVGDVYLQRGALHGWENNTDEYARFWGIMVASEANSTEVERTEKRKGLEDVWWGS